MSGMEWLPVALAGFAAILALFTLLWLASLRLRDASIVDPFWGPAFLLATAVYLAGAGSATPRGLIVLAIVGIWAVRLGVHIYTRNRGHGEDPRYQEFRRQGGTSYWWVSFFRVFLLQAVLAWAISAPLLAAQLADAPLGPLDLAGLALWAAGLLFEAIGDMQLRAFRADPASKGRVLRTGLWAWTRHPNYFGEAVLWWGYFVIALGAGGWWTIFAPALMTFLLVRVSGVALLERGLAARRPGYAAYVREVPAFIPRPPRDPGIR